MKGFIRTAAWRFTVIFAVLACNILPANAADQPNGDDAANLLKAYETIQPPAFDQTKRQEREYVADYVRQRQQYATKKSEAGKAFYEKFPDHPRANAVMTECWMTLAQHGKISEVTSEISTWLDKNPNSPVRAEALFIRAFASIVPSQPLDFEKATQAVDEFIKAAPKDDRGPSLLSEIAMLTNDPAKAAALQRRIVEQYPESQAAKSALGKLRQADGIGKPFELSFTDAISGKTISIGDLQGKVVVIDFWATWCGPCVAEIPHMKEIYAQYKDKGVEFIGVDLDEPEAQGGLTKLKAFVKENGVEWPQYYQGKAWQSDFSTSWGINSIPCVFVVGPDGKLFSVQARAQLETIIPQLLNKSPRS